MWIHYSYTGITFFTDSKLLKRCLPQSVKIEYRINNTIFWIADLLLGIFCFFNTDKHSVWRIKYVFAKLFCHKRFFHYCQWHRDPFGPSLYNGCFEGFCDLAQWFHRWNVFRKDKRFIKVNNVAENRVQMLFCSDNSPRYTSFLEDVGYRELKHLLSFLIWCTLFGALVATT